MKTKTLTLSLIKSVRSVPGTDRIHCRKLCLCIALLISFNGYAQNVISNVNGVQTVMTTTPAGDAGAIYPLTMGKDLVLGTMDGNGYWYQRMYVKYNSGWIGIGTSQPKGRLHVKGDYYGKGHMYLYAYEGDGASGTAYIQARDDSGDSNLSLQFRTQKDGQYVDALRLFSNGNVGIGTATPTELLEVNGNIKVNGSILSAGIALDESNASIGHHAGAAITTGQRNTSFGPYAGSNIDIGSWNTSFGYSAGSGITSGGWNSNFGTHTGENLGGGAKNSNFGYGAGQSITEADHNSNFGVDAGQRTTSGSDNSNFGYRAGRLLTTGTSNVNIGTNAGHSFTTSTGNTVIGALAADQLTNANFSVFLGYKAGSDFSHVTFEGGQNPLDDDRSVFVVNNQAQLHNPLLFGVFAENENHNDPNHHTKAGTMAQLAINTHHLVDSCALTIAGAVHVGPKDLNPTSFPTDSLYTEYLLWVEKGIVSEDFAIVKVEDWADHVFAEDYDLPSLEEVERYIKEYRHLPGMPSEVEVKAQGYSLHEVNKQLLQKVEELTLYSIAQEKRTKELEWQLAEYKTLEERIRSLEAAVR